MSGVNNLNVKTISIVNFEDAIFLQCFTDHMCQQIIMLKTDDA